MKILMYENGHFCYILCGMYFVHMLYMFWILVTVIHWHIRYVYNSQEKIDPQWPRPQLTIHSVHTQPTQKGCVVSNDLPLHTPKLAIVFLLLSPPASTHSAHRQCFLDGRGVFSCKKPSRTKRRRRIQFYLVTLMYHLISRCTKTVTNDWVISNH